MVGDMVSILPVRRVGLAPSLVQRVESFDDAPDGKGCENGALANAFEPLHQNKRQHSRDHHERPINNLFHGAKSNRGHLRERHDQPLTGQVEQFGLNLNVDAEPQNERADNGDDPLQQVVVYLRPAGET